MHSCALIKHCKKSVLIVSRVILGMFTDVHIHPCALCHLLLHYKRKAPLNQSKGPSSPASCCLQLLTNYLWEATCRTESCKFLPPLCPSEPFPRAAQPVTREKKLYELDSEMQTAWIWRGLLKNYFFSGPYQAKTPLWLVLYHTKNPGCCEACGVCEY